MTSGQTALPALRILRAYLLSGAVESLIALVYLLLIPSDPKNALLLGYSPTRLLLTLPFIVLAALFIWLAARTWRDQPWAESLLSRLDQLLQEYSLFVPSMIVLYGLVIFGTYFHILVQTPNLTTLQGYLTRLSPFVLLGMTRAVATLFFLPVWAFARRGLGGKPRGNERGISINPRKLVLVLASFLVLLVLAGLAVDLIRTITYNRSVFGLWQKFNLNQEKNVPTFFSSMLLLLAALLFAAIAALKSSRREAYFRHWAILALIFVYLSLDESAGIHEMLEEPVRLLVPAQGVLFYGWVLVAVPLLLLFLLSYSRFYLHLPPETKIELGLALVFYVGGALFVELLAGWYADAFGESNLTYFLISSFEEALEMVGILVLIQALLKYLQAQAGEITLRYR